MTVRREIAESRGEVRGSTKQSRHACGRRRAGEAAGSDGRARRPKARRSSESAIAAEMLMNHAGYRRIHANNLIRNSLVLCVKWAFRQRLTTFLLTSACVG